MGSHARIQFRGNRGIFAALDAVRDKGRFFTEKGLIRGCFLTPNLRHTGGRYPKETFIWIDARSCQQT